MTQRKLSEINAGSMADIAFLLLIFFLVTTTMDQDKGILRILPADSTDQEPPAPIHENKVFKVLINAQDELMIEDEIEKLSKLKHSTSAFFCNGGVFENRTPIASHVERKWIHKKDIEQEIQALTLRSQKPNVSQTALLKRIQKLNEKLDAIAYFGEYKQLHKSAVISLQNSNGTSYDMYLNVQNELSSAIHELRDDLCQQHFKRGFLDLDIRNPEDRKKVMAVRQVYPQRISEAEAFDR